MESMIAVHNEVLSWLLETDNPGVRYLALRDLFDRTEDDFELKAACAEAHTHGPIAHILDQMDESGFWSKPGHGYGPKYFSSVWSLITLGQLGAQCSQDERISRACAYILDHALTPGGQFSTSRTASGTVDCLQGNLCTALIDLGYEDPRLATAFEWMARSVTGEGVAPKEDKNAALRYYAYKCGPGFACGANNRLPCAWGAVKVMLAFSKLPASQRTPLIEHAISMGIDFLFSVDPAEANYPAGWSDKPSSNWWKFGFPVFYVTDLLQNVEALVRLGYAADERLRHALRVIRDKQDARGRWLMEYNYTGKTWESFGRKGQANKWVTYRALHVLKAAS